ncbi:MAG: D-ribose pyranase [Treponema sp.]|nr:D-ribose pyranase [Treponema sp.]
MKKMGILNSDISRVLSYMRHTDTLCIGDCGLPCPDAVELIDISLKQGAPSFIETLSVVLDDMKVERAFVASEIREKNPLILQQLESLLHGIQIDFVDHAVLKKQTESCKAVVRTGEITPFANIILQSACLF